MIEYIYAGPHDSHVPKTFVGFSPLQALAELGFIVTRGRDGDLNRSRRSMIVAGRTWPTPAFPTGFSGTRPWPPNTGYDITRVGICGWSAGGQNALAALLFTPSSTRRPSSSCGCHDNRMDKLWWNEQWMGWPIGPEYATSSNAENAWRLQGKLLLLVGEIDTNVDPSSTMQVADALIKAGKGIRAGRPPRRESYQRRAVRRPEAERFLRATSSASKPPDWNAPGPPANK